MQIREFAFNQLIIIYKMLNLFCCLVVAKLSLITIESENY